MIIYVDMDDVLADYTTRFNEEIARKPEIKFPQSTFGFYSELKPINGAIESVNYLRSQSQFEVYILSCPSYLNPLSYLEKPLWIEKHFDVEFCKRLILSYDKSLLKGDFLIDDHDCGRGQEGFEGELIQFGCEQYPNWNEVVRYIESRNS
ncbi:5' nucleotidase, NT5C type [Aliikangiella sp. IMCC44632]